MIGELDRWLASLDERKLEAELAELEAERVTLANEIAERKERMAEIVASIEKGQGALRLKLRWLPTEESAIETNGSVPPRGRESVRALMRAMPEVREWTIPTVLGELVKRGWADPDDEHSVGVSLSRMQRGEEIERLRKGVYAPRGHLASPSGDPQSSLSDSEGEDPVSNGGGGR